MQIGRQQAIGRAGPPGGRQHGRRHPPAEDDMIGKVRSGKAHGRAPCANVIQLTKAPLPARQWVAAVSGHAPGLSSPLRPRRPGQSHLADDGSGEGVGPSGTFALSGDGEFGSGGLEQVEGDLSEGGEVFGAVILAVSCTILVEGDVEHPVQPVLDVPVGAEGVGEFLGRGLGSGNGWSWPWPCIWARLQGAGRGAWGCRSVSLAPPPPAFTVTCFTVTFCCPPVLYRLKASIWVA